MNTSLLLNSKRTLRSRAIGHNSSIAMRLRSPRALDCSIRNVCREGAFGKAYQSD
jgi:hypothetical protein